MHKRNENNSTVHRRVLSNQRRSVDTINHVGFEEMLGELEAIVAKRKIAWQESRDGIKNSQPATGALHYGDFFYSP
ncbi:hypothetical protein ACNKHO_19555 [Shigella flexneri]